MRTWGQENDDVGHARRVARRLSRPSSGRRMHGDETTRAVQIATSNQETLKIPIPRSCLSVRHTLPIFLVPSPSNLSSPSFLLRSFIVLGVVPSLRRVFGVRCRVRQCVRGPGTAVWRVQRSAVVAE